MEAKTVRKLKRGEWFTLKPIEEPKDTQVFIRCDYVGQIMVEYNYNPLGRYFNLWFYRDSRCVFTATLFNENFFLEAVHEVGEQLCYGRLQSYKAWNPDTHDIVIEGVYE